MATNMRKLLMLLALLVLTIGLLTTAAMATEETFDTENFQGLVLTTSVGSDQVWVRLYKGYTTPKDANLIQPVYTEATADGGMAYYYEVGVGRYKCFTRHPSNSTRYYTEKSIYMSAEEVATKTVHDVTTGKRSTSGWDPSSRVYLYTDEVMAQTPVLHNTGRALVDGTLTDTLTESQQTLRDRMTCVQYYLSMDAEGKHP